MQRALGIGYGRSARLIDFMAEDGIVGTYNGAQARDVSRERSLHQAVDESSARLEGLLAGKESSPSNRAVRQEDLLHPQEEDFIVQNEAHDEDCHYAKDVLLGG